MKRSLILLSCLLSTLLITSCSSSSAPGNSNYISFSSLEEAHSYFSHKGDGSVLLSGHRGGREAGYPENSIEGFQNVLDQAPAIFEIDPRLTKDSVIVLMHDATLDRTTDASGKISDYTWEELQTVRLKDNEGNITPYKIPTLEEAILWSKGKTVINLDKKDVPLQMIADLIKRLKAEKHVMLTIHTGEQARFYNEQLPGIMMSVFARNEKEYNDMAASGVSWKNMIAYVGPTINNANREIVEKLHSHGVRCMVSFAPTHDKLSTREERLAAYRSELATKPDIIESDIPTEVWEVLK